jgi:hypothetical protein
MMDTPAPGGTRRRLLRVLIALVLAATGLAFAPGPALAVGPAPYGGAYVRLDATDASMCLVPATHNWNEVYDIIPVNAICSDNVGEYSVYLPDLGARAGLPHVTAVGAGSEYCKILGWGPSGTEQRIRVLCFTATGTPADTLFTLSYTNNETGRSPYPFGYLYASQPTTPSYTPPANYQFNSSGAANTVTKVAGQTGRYTASLPTLAGAGAQVQVTAYGTGTQWCGAGAVGASGTTATVEVRCYDGTGAAADAQFTLTYVRNGSLFGRSLCCSWVTPVAYTHADRPTVASYLPANRFGFDGSSLVTRLSTGRYELRYHTHPRNEGTVQVTASGSTSARCKVESWNAGLSATVRCTDPAGAPRDASFYLIYTGKSSIS